MNASGAAVTVGRNSANLYRGDGGVVCVCVCLCAGACVCVRVRACVMRLQYTIIIFDPG